MRKWTIEDSFEIYNVKGWGNDYMSINDAGNLCIQPHKDMAKAEIKEIIDELANSDIDTPVLLRFPDILNDRLRKISSCFKKAKDEYSYKGEHYTVFPIKVNQMQPVVEEIVKQGQDYNLGLEAGSKPELHAVLASVNDPESVIICNGYKDEAFIELALLAQKMGRKIFIVVEKLNELRLTIRISKQLGILPNVGIRIKLSSEGSGKWESSGGDKSKFGLSSSELLAALDILRENKMEKAFRLIHFHLGSQITKIRMIKNALSEAVQFYVQLRKLGFEIDFFDVGGGLGIDYDGTNSTRASSANYSTQEYANDIIFNVVNASNKNNLPHPNVINESGRALTAHHTALIFNVLEESYLPYWNSDKDILNDNDDELIKELSDILDNLTKSRVMEAWHDALQIRDEALSKFSMGILNLENRAKMEKLFWSIVREIYKISQEFKHIPEEFRVLPRLLAHKYFCNFSIFQSLPDAWAIDQIFPIMPIQKLDIKPSINVTLQDITCDSDGKIENFIGLGEKAFILPVHQFDKKENYYIGVFLVGAYQEILGDLHNLFGDVNIAHISIDKKGYEISKIIDGETVSEVLSYVQYDSKKLVKKMERWVTSSVKIGRISPKEGKEFISNYRAGLYGYTYLVSE